MTLSMARREPECRSSIAFAPSRLAVWGVFGGATGKIWRQFGALAMLLLDASSGGMHCKMTPPHDVGRASNKPPFTDLRSDWCAQRNTFAGRPFPLPQ